MSLFQLRSHRRASITEVAVTAAILSGPVLVGAGCAGSSPQLSTPQMNTPTLPQPNVGGARSVASGAGGSVQAATEAKLAPLEPVTTPPDTFVALPYIQLGEAARGGGKTETLTLVWQGAADTNADWTVETSPAGMTNWKKTAGKPEAQTVAVEGVKPHRVWRVVLAGLSPGVLFDYRVSLAGKPVFAARARARRGAAEPYRVVLIGDTGAGSPDEKKVVYQASLAKPDLVFITGDIVYDRGRASEYQTRFWPIFNADTASETGGAPLLRSTLALAAPGNHDIAYRDLEKYPDGLAYFYYWNQPLNGPALAFGADNTPSPTGGSDAAKGAFTSAAGPAYPRMANYSFDYGNAHWTVLDSNPYVNWSAKELRAWVEKDLAGAKGAAWRFVAFHHPPFNSSKTHRDAQQMRVLCDLFEKHRVDIVWNGHVHNYQRTHPLRFTVKTGADGRVRADSGAVDGEWKLDKAFDGEKNTRPDGVIYVITGGGGAGLYDKQMQDSPETWLPFTKQYIGDKHSLTIADVEGKTLTVRQLDEDGKERDRFVVTKP